MRRQVHQGGVQGDEARRQPESLGGHQQAPAPRQKQDRATEEGQGTAASAAAAAHGRLQPV